MILNRKKKFFYIFLICLIVSITAINIHQYFVLYPKHMGTFMSFSPVSNEIAKFINKNSKDYYILSSQAKNMYGFHMWEQKIVCDFATFNKGKYSFMMDYNLIRDDQLAGKKGVVIIYRPTDVKEMEKLEQEYKGIKKEVHKHPLYFHDEAGQQTDIMFIVYYLNKEEIKKAKNENELYTIYRY